MPVTIFHVGLPLDHPLIEVEERPKIALRLKQLQERMRDAGYRYEYIYCSPEGGLGEFRDRLKMEPCDGLLIGGGVAGNPDLSHFLEQMIDAAHAVVPRVKIMFFNHSEDVLVTVERWFKA